jgi:EAL domain-containing protein (putative c-di-GMP-specific phosphodiesterase class I)/GGDEF domain-containing protein
MLACSMRKDIGSKKELIDLLEQRKKVTYFLLNIDNFSNMNSAYGYEVGTQILCQVIRYINIVKPISSHLFHYSSDKFVILDECGLTKIEIQSIAEEILSFFSQSEIIIDDALEFNISLSIGISTGRGVLNITQAELAIKEARESKRHYYNIYDEKSLFMQGNKKDIYWILKIRDAVANENIIAYFQPIINNATGRVEKYECLARIKDENEIISPYMFMDAARVTGNLSYVTQSLISQSFKKFSGTDYEFSLNITGADFLLDYLEFFLLKNAKKYNVDPSKVVLEMLEDITSLDSGNTLAQLQSLREKGFKIAIDDFGAENSNMSRLLEIYPDYLKIDGAFVKDIVTDKKSQIIVDSIVMLCKNSKIKIIAEYIHNKEVQEYIKALGIEYSQGYYFGEPSADLLAE